MDSKPKTTVLVADQSRPFREALRAVLEQQEDLELAGEAEHDRQLAAMLKTRPIDILVLDAELPRAGELGALRAAVHSLHPSSGSCSPAARSRRTSSARPCCRASGGSCSEDVAHKIM